eukprot:10625-Heterococcus_DN1.PRE.6
MEVRYVSISAGTPLRTQAHNDTITGVSNQRYSLYIASQHLLMTPKPYHCEQHEQSLHTTETVGCAMLLLPIGTTLANHQRSFRVTVAAAHTVVALALLVQRTQVKRSSTAIQNYYAPF